MSRLDFKKGYWVGKPTGDAYDTAVTGATETFAGIRSALLAAGVLRAVAVVPDLTAPTFTSANPSSSSLTVGDTVTGTVTTNDPTATFAVSGADAAKLTLDANTGDYSLDTSASGDLTMTVTATDPSGNPRSEVWTFSISVAAPGPNAPVLTKLNAAGDPLDLQVQVDETVSAGMYWDLQLAGAGDFVTPLSGEGTIRDLDPYQMITADDLAAGGAGPMFSILSNIPAGAEYARLRVGYDDGASILWGAWSNVVMEDVVTLVPAVLDPASMNATYNTITTDFTLSNKSAPVGALRGARTTQSRTGKIFAAVSIDALNASAPAYQGATIAIGNSDSVPATNGNGGPTGSVARFFGSYIYDATNSIVRSRHVDWLVAGGQILIAFDNETDPANPKFWFGYAAAGAVAGEEVWDGNPAAGTGGSVAPLGALFIVLLTYVSTGGTTTLTLKTTDNTFLPTGFEVNG